MGVSSPPIRCCRAAVLGSLAALLFAVVCCRTESAEAETARLRVALLPIFDVLPYHVAEAGGYFSPSDMRIEAVPVGSALDRDQLLQAGEVDGVVNELISAANFNRDQTRVMVVGTARKPGPGSPLFRVLVSPGSELRRPSDLAGVPIGVALNTIIEYVTDRMLADQGLASSQIRKTSVPAIPERFQLLAQGRLRAAVLPDPQAQSAMAAGAVEILNDTAYGRYSTSIITFSSRAVREKAGAIRLFLAGWRRAAAEINSRPDAYRELLLRKIRVPENLQGTFRMPIFPGPEVPGADQWKDVMEWMKAKGMIAAPLSYHGSVTDAFLQRQP